MTDVATGEGAKELRAYSKSVNYELFIGALSVLSIINLFAVIFFPNSDFAAVSTLMDIFLSLIFILDFTYRLFTAPSKSGYFFRNWGWLDLLSSIPFPQFKILRLVRIFRVYRLVQQYGAKALLKQFIDDRANSALLVLAFLILLVLEFGGYLEYRIESGAPDANITTAGDSIWYTFVTITTVGYGDRYPVTPLGRVVGMAIMMCGVALFGALAGYLANAFLAPPKAKPAATPTAGDPVAQRMDEIRGLVAANRDAQAALDAKLDELDALLAKAGPSSTAPVPGGSAPTAGGAAPPAGGAAPPAPSV